jgi:hypothetical protein
VANIKLLDTGYVGSTRSGATQLGVTERAGYTGSTVVAFSLKVTLDLSSQVKVENKPVVDNFSEVKTTLVSSENRVIRVGTVLNKIIVTSGYDKNNLYQLSRMDRTKGLKLMYVDSTSDTYKTIVEALGAANTGGVFGDVSPSEANGTVSTSTPYLLGRVKNLHIKDDEQSNFFKIDFDFELCG